MDRALINSAVALMMLSSMFTHAEESLTCDLGPLQKSFGGTDWYVYACNDNFSTVAISAPGNPATPFYFFMTIKDNELRITGEGNGDKSSSEAALQELSILNRTTYWDLHNTAKKIGK